MAHPNKRQILLGLESGRKLHELMREPGMPSKALLEEWRDNDPEFNDDYEKAEEAGRRKRGEQPAPKKAKPAPVVTDQDGREHPIPPSTALQTGKQYPGLAFDPADPLDAASDETPPNLSEAVAEVPAHAPVPEPELAVPFADKLTRALESNLIFLDDYARILAITGEAEAEAELVRLLQAPRQPPAGFQVPTTQSKKAAALEKAREAKAAKRGQPKQPAEVDATKVAQDMQRYVYGLELKVVEDAQHREAQRAEIRALREFYEKAKAFKTYVHERLDAEGFDPQEAENAVSGCRIGKRLDAVFTLIGDLREQLDGHQEYQADVKRLTRELDVALFGEENAAPQASLCDLISPARKLAESLRQHATQTEQRDKVELTKPVPHPGQLLAAAMDLTGTTRKQLAQALSIKLDTLKSILGGKCNLSLQLCAALEAANWGRTELWSRRQIDYLAHRKATVAG